VKRAALLILVVGAPLVLLFFPELRRRIARKLRFLLLLWAGAVLFVGLFAGRGRNFLEGKEAWEIGLGLFGLALFVGAFLSVLKDSSRSSSSSSPSKNPGAKRR
jgi:MFS-type transporter involved in bile tolerance (Atg22 family)